MTGKDLKLLRKPKMTLEHLSEVTGISTSQLSRFESDKRKPRVEEAIRIAKALNVPVTDIFTELGAPMTDTEDFTGIAFSALMESVRRSYYMLGLDIDEATSLLQLVLGRARALTIQPEEDDFRQRQLDAQDRKFLRAKKAQDDQT